MNRECVTCKFIEDCQTVTPQKILEHYVCDNYQEVDTPEQVRARCDVITKFGLSGLRALIKPDAEEA